MRARSVIVAVAVAAAIAAAGAGYWLFASLDGQVKRAIERWGPEITGVAVRVGSVKIDAAEGRGTIKGLRLGNPKGFAGPYALELGEARLTLDPASLARDVVVINELLLVGPDVAYERAQGGNNLEAIQRNIDAWLAKNAGARQDAGAKKKFVIDSVIIRDGRAQLGSTLASSMPLLQLRDIGKKTDGANAGEAAKQVWGAMQRSVANMALRAGPAVKDGWNRPSN